MNIEPLYELTAGCKSAPEVIKVLLDRGMISTTAIEYAQITYEYRRNLESCQGSRCRAVYDTAIRRNVSDRKVRYAIEKFKDN